MRACPRTAALDDGAPTMTRQTRGERIEIRTASEIDLRPVVADPPQSGNVPLISVIDARAVLPGEDGIGALPGNRSGSGGAKALHARVIGKPYRKADLARMLRKTLADGTGDRETL